MTNRNKEIKAWPYVWMEIAHKIAKYRSHDPKRQVGCVITPIDNTGILALGYNGRHRSGPNEPATDKPGQSKCIHAEVNALIKLNYYDHIKKLVMYVTTSPCEDCAAVIVNARINTVIYDELYRDQTGLELLKNSDVDVVDINNSCELTEWCAKNNV